MWQLYYLLLRGLNPFMRIGFRVWNVWFPAPRARVVLLRADGKIFLVQHGLGRGKWTLPGGGVDRGEAPEAAARRELQEELRLVLAPEEMHSLGEYVYEGVTMPLFAAEVDDLRALALQPYRIEIKKWQWFNVGDVPSDAHPVVRVALEHLSSVAEIAKIEKVTFEEPHTVQGERSRKDNEN